MRISDWSSDVCSSDLERADPALDLSLCDAVAVERQGQAGQRQPDADVAGPRQPPQAVLDLQRAAAAVHALDAVPEFAGFFSGHNLISNRRTSHSYGACTVYPVKSGLMLEVYITRRSSELTERTHRTRHKRKTTI